MVMRKLSKGVCSVMLGLSLSCMLGNVTVIAAENFETEEAIVTEEETIDTEDMVIHYTPDTQVITYYEYEDGQFNKVADENDIHDGETKDNKKKTITDDTEFFILPKEDGSYTVYSIYMKSGVRTLNELQDARVVKGQVEDKYGVYVVLKGDDGNKYEVKVEIPEDWQVGETMVVLASKNVREKENLLQFENQYTYYRVEEN